MNPRDLGRHALLKGSFLHGLGIITTWMMQLFVMSIISNILNNHHDYHEYLMDAGIHRRKGLNSNKKAKFVFYQPKYIINCI